MGKIKMKVEIDLVKEADDIKYYIGNKLICSIKKSWLDIHFINVEDEMLVIEGNVLLYAFINKNEFEISAKIENEYIKAIYTGEIMPLNQIAQNAFFKVKIPLPGGGGEKLIKLVLKHRNIEFEPKMIFYTHSKIFSNTYESYFAENGFCISVKENVFRILPDTFAVSTGMELRLLKNLIKQKEYKLALVRGLAYIAAKLKRKEIWVFSDRPDKADDNAEVFYKYCLNKNDNIKCYFIINKDSVDFYRLKPYGKIIPSGGLKHKLIILLADKVISSHTQEHTSDIFDSNNKDKELKSLLKFKFVFLQHGIIQSDLTSYLHRIRKNIDLFITSTVPEYKSILEGGYGYNDNIVKLTGLPRYDKLKNNDKKQILIIPTWRASLVDYTGKEYNPRFKMTEYFKNWNKLLNDPHLIDVCSQRGYKIVFFPHYHIRCQIRDFDKNDAVRFGEFGESYNTLFCESSLLITDYSSVAFDFVYLKKPIVYYQFDYDQVFNWKELGIKRLHTCSKGYFDHKTMGFGQVCDSYTEVINSIINIIENDCKMEDIYKQRVDDFFAYTDINNCERVYNAIRDMDKK